jgi:hypothetical protein
MDEKWHVFAEENVVFLHRSWSRSSRSEDEFDCGVVEAVLSNVASADWPENSE